MELHFNWINLLILFGALQGLIFGIILLFGRKLPGARFLSIFMFALAYNGFETFNWSSQLDRHVVFFDLFPFVMIYAVGPSLYLYIKSLLIPEKGRSLKKILLHYSPVIFQFFMRVSIIILYFLFINNITPGNAALETLDHLYYWYSEPLSIVVFLIYLYLSFKLFKKAKSERNTSLVTKEAQKEIYKWVKILLWCMLFLAVMWPLTILAPAVFNLPHDLHYYPVELVLVVFIYWISFVGYLRTKTIYSRISKNSQISISGSEAKRILAQLHHAMENDKLYLNPGLNRQKVATHTGINAKTISSILNRYSSQSFNDFVNEFRVRRVCEKLRSGESRHLTISGVALESGFNSQATFQRAFKNITGMSPRKYLTLESNRQNITTKK